ncbi:Xaa-Pro dipeptidase [Dasania sp. GY-MA-18]|uniref:Xaa-Pro dipeptidase n=1 Tax=Dasania phycosphaerae TaxID=2950436 RepID=A0A9J6RNZ7_9GAMM|nr:MULTISPECIES: Xaa-Pro dipeptidase [Dasania]MCR8923802.1 Xaa-Pro dipeptidase [Dasania sp. GY-MA-18]MCZ0866236.1 Xaa-Pro dipeptidase [Dasania phycosphaerae]MCZ0869960.1 Xaa-Pro dipeptidase [Dasania phycosphaerae]
MLPSALTELYLKHVKKRFTETCEWLNQLGYSRLLIAAGDSHYHFRDDTDYPFKLNPYFASWLNLSEGAGSWLIIDSQKPQPSLLHYCPEDIWHQPAPLRDEVVQQAFEVIPYADAKDLKPLLNSKQQPSVYIGEPNALIAELPHCVSNCEQLLNLIDYHRAYKSEYEQGCIQLANHSAAIGHKAAAEAFYNGGSEYQIHMAYLQATQQLENEQPYNSIIALNEHAAVLHYPQKQRTKPEAHRSFLIDAGTCVGGYASDISRSYAFSSSDFADLIIAMNKLHEKLVDSLSLGQSYLDLHLAAHLGIAKILLEFKLAKGSVESLLEQKVTQVFFPHGVGHYLGIQVHDRGGWLSSPLGDVLEPPKDHPYLRLTRKLEANQIFTVEPGLYFIEPLLQQAKQDARKELINWPAVSAMQPWGGIRIEDNILMTAQGVTNLTQQASLA